MLPFIAVLVLLQTTAASIAGTTLQNVAPSTSRENLQRSLKTKTSDGLPQEPSKMATDKDELARVAKFKRLGMEIGTLDEFLISTTQRNGHKEGYFIFPPVIDFGDEKEPEEPKKPTSGSFYAPSFEKRKPTAEKGPLTPVPVEHKPVPEGEIPDEWNWTPGPGEKWTGPLTPAPTKDKPPKPEDNSGEPKRNASAKPEVTSGDPDFAFPVNLADRFGAEGDSGEPKGNASVAKPEVPSGAPRPSYLPDGTSPGNPPPPRHPEDDSVKPEVTSKVPDLNYKPSRPPFWPSSGTTPPKHEEEVSQSTEKESKVPDLNYKPTRPFFLPSLSTSPPKQEEEVSHSTEKETKVPDLNYKPTRPSYLPTLWTLKPPKPEEEAFHSSTEKEASSTEKEASKVPDLNYKPTRPFYYPTSSTLKPSKHEEELLQSSTEKETSKVPDLNYKPTRPFYYPTLATSPPKHEEEVIQSSTEASKVPDLSYKPMRPFYAGNYPYSTKFPPKPPVENQQGGLWTSKPLYESNYPHGSTRPPIGRPPTTYKVPQLGYKPMRPFYAGNWNGYPLPTTKSPSLGKKVQDGDLRVDLVHLVPLPTTKSPSFEKKLQDGDLRVDSVHLVKIQFKNGSEEEKVTEDTLNKDNTSKPEVSTQKDTLLTTLDKVVDSVKNLGKTVRNFRQEVTSINFSKIKDAVASLFKL